MNTYLDTNKQQRSITIADNWKAKQIKQILTVRDEMIINNIDRELIKIFLEEQYQVNLFINYRVVLSIKCTIPLHGLFL